MLTVPEGFTVTAHTGACFTPYNSVRSIKKAIAVGADITETDVTFRKDGTVVTIHSDAPTDKQGVPFADILAAASKSNTIRMNLDLKAFWNTRAVQELAQQYGMLERVFYTGVFENEIEKVRAGSPLIPYYLNSGVDAEHQNDTEFIEALAHKIISLGAIGINAQFRKLNKNVTDIMHSHNLLVSAWTVNKKDDMASVLSYGVDNITTKAPKKLIKLIK